MTAGEGICWRERKVYMSSDLPDSSVNKPKARVFGWPLALASAFGVVLCIGAFCAFAVFSGLPGWVSSRLAQTWRGFSLPGMAQPATPPGPTGDFPDLDQRIAQDPGNADA